MIMTPDLERPGSRIRLIPLLRRRWWLLVLTTVAVAAAGYAVTTLKEERHTAQALVVVPTGTSSKAPGSANDAEQLAATYAALIPQDVSILREVGRVTGLPRERVERGIEVINTTDTALLELRFEDPEADRAVTGARSLARAVDRGVSPNVPDGTMGIVRLPSEPLAATPGGDAAGLLAGLLLGLFLGCVTMVFLERADARGDDERDFADALGLPSTTLGRRSVGPQVPLIDRWEQVAARAGPRVALVPVTRRAQAAARRAAEALAEAACERGRYVVVDEAVSAPVLELATGGGGEAYDRSDAPGDPTVLAPAAAPGRDPSGEIVGLSSHVVVLVARRGDPLRKAQARLASLRGLGIEVERTLVVPRRVRSGEGG